MGMMHGERARARGPPQGGARTSARMPDQLGRRMAIGRAPSLGGCDGASWSWAVAVCMVHASAPRSDIQCDVAMGRAWVGERSGGLRVERAAAHRGNAGRIEVRTLAALVQVSTKHVSCVLFRY